jgi:hypothetical protein
MAAGVRKKRLTNRDPTRNRCRRRMLNGWYRWPRRELRHCNNIVVGTISLSTSAVRRMSVNGIPNMAYKMQKIFPPFDSGVTWP